MCVIIYFKLVKKSDILVHYTVKEVKSVTDKKYKLEIRQ